MKGEIIAIGNELVSGKTRDLNAWYAAGRLTRAGLKVQRMTSVGDEPETVIRVLKEAMERAGFLIITGGLGSTEDDITSQVVAEALNRPLCLHEGMADKIRRVAQKRNLTITQSLLKMAYMPEGSVLFTEKGVACGFYIVEREIPLYFLPGVPEQMRYLIDNFVLPDILSRFQVKGIRFFRLIRTYGLTEPEIAERFRGNSLNEKGVVLGYYPQFPENHITITAEGSEEGPLSSLMDEAEQEVLRRLKEYVFSTQDEEMEEVVGKRLRERGLTLSSAESCTGGLLGHKITNVPGSSNYYLGGVVAYSNGLKEALLGVSKDTLERFGAVSRETVEEMAKGIGKKTGSDISIAITGIAGPEGGSEKKPVGTVFIGMQTPKAFYSMGYRFYGTRSQIKENSAHMALDWIRRYVDGYPFIPGI